MLIEPTPIEQIIQQNQKLKSLRDEDILDLELIPKEKDEGTREIKKCSKYLRLNKAIVPSDLCRLLLPELTMLFLDAANLRNESKNGLTGLKIIFGASKVDDIISLTPIFQPVYMRRIALQVAAGDYETIYGKYYHRDDKDIKVIPEEEMKRYTENYKNNVKIVDESRARNLDFIPGIDTESVIFPFQTIFTLLYDNGNAKGVFMYNSIRKDRDMKHCVLLSSQKMLGNSFKGKYANRSHLCPPDCNTLKYSIAKFL